MLQIFLDEETEVQKCWRTCLRSFIRWQNRGWKSFFPLQTNTYFLNVLGCLWAKEIYNHGYIFHEKRCLLSNFVSPTIFIIAPFTIYLGKICWINITSGFHLLNRHIIVDGLLSSCETWILLIIEIHLSLKCMVKMEEQWQDLSSHLKQLINWTKYIKQ